MFYPLRSNKQNTHVNCEVLNYKLLTFIKLLSMKIIFEKSCLLVVILVSFSFSVLAQNRTITGKVKDATGIGVPGATIMAVGTKTGTVTDIEGNFSMPITETVKKLNFSFIGFISQEVILTSQSNVDVVLLESSFLLDEVVAIGYGKMKKKDLTGASASVSGNEIKNIPVTTAAQALTGKAAGVNVTSFSGAPGADINIVVRGGTSLTQSNEPLYIVDGFQMDNALKFIDTQDIEAIDILKDASATAIYGAKGSNGVILITTKSAKKGKTEISYNGYISFQQIGKKLNVLSPYEFVKLQHEHYTLGKNISTFNALYGSFDQMHNLYDNADAINWLDLMYGGTGVLRSHNVNISSGNEKSRFNLSYNNTTEDAILNKYGLVKNNIRVKLAQELMKGVRLDFSTNFNDNKRMGGGNLGGRLKNAVLSRPVGGLLYTNDELLNMYGSDTRLSEIDPSVNYDIQNPIISNEATTNTQLTRRFDSNGSLEIDLAKGLTFKTAGSYFWQQVRSDYWDDGRTLDAETKGGPYGSRSNAELWSYQLTNTLTFDKKFNNQSLTILGGQEVLYNEQMNIASGTQKFPNGSFGLDDMSMGTITNNNTSGRSRSGIVSLFGRAYYNLNEKYMLTATMRADGSSKFAESKKWGYFPSASGAWRIIEEDFMKEQSTISNLKLRIGYGTSGNCNVANGMYLTSYESSVYGYNKTEQTAIVPTATLGNNILQWETIVSTNIGLDLSLFKNRINITADIYNNISDNLLMNSPIPATTGYTYQYQNVGSIRNRGLELVINTLNFKNRNFSWTTDFNIAFNRNKVLKLYGEDANQQSLLYTSGTNGAAYWIQVGQPLGQIYGFVYDGFYTANDFNQQANGSYLLKPGIAYDKTRKPIDVKPGDAKLKAGAGNVDAAGNPTWTADDREVIGNANPNFTGGITNTFTYKNFDLSIFMNFVSGNDVVNLSTQRFVSSYISNQNALSILANRYTTIDPTTGLETSNLTRLGEINTNASIWSVNPNVKTNVTLNSYYIEDGSFLRINNISLGYSFPKTWLKKAHISNARIYGTLNNIYTFTKYSGFDPEVTSSSSALNPGIDDSSFPRSKSYVVGLNLTF